MMLAKVVDKRLVPFAQSLSKGERFNPITPPDNSAVPW